MLLVEDEWHHQQSDAPATAADRNYYRQDGQGKIGPVFFFQSTLLALPGFWFFKEHLYLYPNIVKTNTDES